MIEMRDAMVWEVTDRLEADVRSVGLDGGGDVGTGVDEIVAHFCNNPSQARGWLTDLLRGTPDSPGAHLLQRKTELTALLSTSGLGRDGVDTEVLAALLLGGGLLWSVVSQHDRRPPAESAPRLAAEIKRLLTEGAIADGVFDEAADPVGAALHNPA